MGSRLPAQFLADKQRCGVYRVPADFHPPGSPRLLWKPLAPARLDHDGLLDALARTLEFPAYFGRNWDAAWDCLTELDWPRNKLLVIHLPLSGVADAGDLRLFVELLHDACAWWAQRDHALCLLLAGERHDLPLLDTLPWLPGP